MVGRFHSLGWAITAGLGIGALESLSVYVNGVHPDFPAGAGELIPLVLVLVVLAFRGQTMPSRGSLMQVTLGRAPRPHWRIATAIVGTASASPPSISSRATTAPPSTRASSPR